MKVIFLFIAMASCQFIVGQSLYKTSIDAGGASTTNGNIELIYTIGEVFVSERKVDNTTLSEGFIGDGFSTLVALEDFDLERNVMIYPNPIYSFFAISTDLKIDKLVIYDLFGNKVRETTKTEGQIGIDTLPVGLYTIKLFVQEKSFTKRIVVER